MSNLFLRPKPESAGAQDVLREIADLVCWDWECGYTFAHIVIDDLNLDDASILYCLRPGWIAEVTNGRIKDEFDSVVDPTDLQPWQYPIYAQHIQQMAEVIDLLNWLLDVPAAVRQEAQEIYTAWENA